MSLDSEKEKGSCWDMGRDRGGQKSRKVLQASGRTESRPQGLLYRSRRHAFLMSDTFINLPARPNCFCKNLAHGRENPADPQPPEGESWDPRVPRTTGVTVGDI